MARPKSDIAHDFRVQRRSESSVKLVESIMYLDGRWTTGRGESFRLCPRRETGGARRRQDKRKAKHVESIRLCPGKPPRGHRLLEWIVPNLDVQP